MYIFTDPKGNTYEVEQWTKFCREKKLNKGNIYRVIKGDIAQSLGWTAFKKEEEREWRIHNKKLRDKSRSRRLFYKNPFYAVSPSGVIHEFDSQKEFMKTFEVFKYRQAINRVLSGERKQAKGWHFIRKTKMSYDEVREIALKKRLKQ